MTDTVPATRHLAFGWLAGVALVTGYWQPLPPSRPAEGSANA